MWHLGTWLNCEHTSGAGLIVGFNNFRSLFKHKKNPVILWNVSAISGNSKCSDATDLLENLVVSVHKGEWIQTLKHLGIRMKRDEKGERTRSRLVMIMMIIILFFFFGIKWHTWSLRFSNFCLWGCWFHRSTLYWGHYGGKEKNQ